MPCTALQQTCNKLVLPQLSNLNLERDDYASISLKVLLDLFFFYCHTAIKHNTSIKYLQQHKN